MCPGRESNWCLLLQEDAQLPEPHWSGLFSFSAGRSLVSWSATLACFPFAPLFPSVCTFLSEDLSFLAASLGFISTIIGANLADNLANLCLGSFSLPPWAELTFLLGTLAAWVGVQRAFADLGWLDAAASPVTQAAWTSNGGSGRMGLSVAFWVSREVRSHRTCLSLSDLSHLAQCPQVSSTLLQMTRFPFLMAE